MQRTSRGLVIKVMDVKENDRLITILTADYGIVRAFVSGAKKSNHKNHAATSLFCYCDFLFALSGDTYKVKEATLITSFFKLSSDILKLSLAQYFCELASQLVPEDTMAEEQLKLTLNTLNFLAEGEKSIFILKSVFELRILSISGYMPDLSACNECGNFEDEVMCFYFEDGSITCQECRVDGRYAYIDKTLLATLRHIVYSDFKKIFSFVIPDQAAKKLSKITEEFVIFQTDRNYQSLNFFKSLL